jgi:hypothetical protein
MVVRRSTILLQVKSLSYAQCANITLQYRARIVTTCHFVPKILTIEEWVHFFGSLCSVRARVLQVQHCILTYLSFIQMFIWCLFVNNGWNCLCGCWKAKHNPTIGDPDITIQFHLKQSAFTCRQRGYCLEEFTAYPGNTKGSNLAAVMFTTVQVSRLPLWPELLVSSRA